MKIGITGSNGILGSEFIKLFNKKDVRSFQGRIEKIKDVEKWICKNNFDKIFHFAAIVPTVKVNSNMKKALLVNYIGTKNIIDTINKFSKKKVWFFYSSTSHVYNFYKSKQKERQNTKPISYYGQTKLFGENYILSNKAKIIPCIGRIFSFTSNKQDKNFIIPSILTKLKNNNKEIKFQNLRHIRDFLPINNIIKAIKLLSIKKVEGIFNICSSRKVDLQNLTIELNQKYKKKITFSNNTKKSVLFGCNKKLIDLGWKIDKIKYSNYLLKNILL